MIPDGVHPTVHRDDYDKIDRTNFSWLKHFAKSPAHARHFKIEPPPDTDAKKLGRVVHLAAFEPERFRSRIAVWDGKVRNGKAWDDFEKANAGLEILTKNELAKCLAIQKAVQADAEAMKYVQGGRGEVSLCWTLHQQMTDGTTDAIACKGRMDFYARGALVDLKSTRDASREAFGRQAFGLNYHTQGAWFQDAIAALGRPAMPYVIVAVENEALHAVKVWRVPDEALELGRQTYRRWLNLLASCRRTNEWPAYGPEEDLVLPRYAYPYEDEEEILLTSGGKPL
jgi:hypothetical protein